MKKNNDIRTIMKNDFVVFILTHGRADNVATARTLRNKHYTGRIVFVVDNEDDTVDEYKRNFGEENVYVFDKARVAETFDEGLAGDRRTVVYARNACFEIARELGYRYFMELDDDYTDFRQVFDRKGEYRNVPIKRTLTECIEAMLKYYISTPKCVKSIAMAQGGDFIGGNDSNMLDAIKTKRKAMNSFICDTERPFQFLGRINEDVNTYTCNTHRGDIFLTINQLRLDQGQTQANNGGMTDVYLDTGTYLKSFFSVMYHPSGVKISTMGSAEKRIHHRVNWNCTAPRIIAEKYKKTE